jgi:dTDP-4-dehydrorhamnose 3,5-epimerase
VSGEVWDVVVDIRRDSATFGQGSGMSLSADNRRQIWIPPGFAHGFLVTSDVAEVLYKTTDYWAPEHERCIRWDDATLAIDWPLVGEPVLSEKDMQGVSFLTATLPRSGSVLHKQG